MLGIGYGSDTSKGGGQLALEDASSDGVRYFGGGCVAVPEMAREIIFL